MNRVRLALAVTAASLVLCGPGVARAQEVGSAECCVRLLEPIGARALALGNALTARMLPDVLYVNPAGIAGVGVDEFRVHSERTDLDKTTTFVLLFGIGSIGTAAISYRLVDYGDIPALNNEGIETGTLRLTDQLLGASFATTILRRIDAGVTYTLYQLRQECSGFCQDQPFTGTTHAVDLGIRAEVPWVRALELGAAVQHLGLPLQVKNAPQRDPAPTRVRVGLAYEVLQHFRPDSTMQLVASADLLQGVRAGVDPRAALGLELILDASLFVRAGYASGTGKGTGGSVGVGMIWDRFDVSVAKSFSSSDDGGEPFQVTFAIRF